MADGVEPVATARQDIHGQAPVPPGPVHPQVDGDLAEPRGDCLAKSASSETNPHQLLTALLGSNSGVGHEGDTATATAARVSLAPTPASNLQGSGRGEGEHLAPWVVSWRHVSGRDRCAEASGRFQVRSRVSLAPCWRRTNLPLGSAKRG
jgi:hypothetical protein